MLTAFALLLCATAGLAYFNERFWHFPTTVGVTLAGAAASTGLIALDALGVAGLRGWPVGFLETLDFTKFVLGAFSACLLFA